MKTTPWTSSENEDCSDWTSKKGGKKDRGFLRIKRNLGGVGKEKRGGMSFGSSVRKTRNIQKKYHHQAPDE